MTDFKENLLTHYKKYPLLEIEDIFKFIYQGAYGCEHMISSPHKATDGIINEYSNEADLCYIENLSDKYCRVHLSCLSNGLEASTLGTVFFLSAKKEEDGEEKLLKMLDTVSEMIDSRALKFPKNEFIKNGIATQNTKFVVNHFSHNSPFALYDDMSKICEKDGFIVSYDGLEVEF